MKLKKGKVNLLIDGQFGSTGKGLLASYIGKHNHIDICVSNAGPNSGHTFYYNNNKFIVRQLPVTAITNPKSKIYLCSGAVINITTLFKELYMYDIDIDRLYIHPKATIIQKEDIKLEQEGNTTNRISSTQNGVGSALARKINRSAKVAEDYQVLNRYINKLDIPELLEQSNTVLMEVPQGYSLSLNSKFYPYCTSRNISVSSALNDLEVHPHYLGKTIASIRTYPIRVGDLPHGYSGDFYSDSIETSWEEIGVPIEYTTNTKRIRRVASFSLYQYQDMLKELRPDYVFLNFCNYLNEGDLNELLCLLPEVTHLGFGSKIENIRGVYE